jgi:hypothetical protein
MTGFPVVAGDGLGRGWFFGLADCRVLFGGLRFSRTGVLGGGRGDRRLGAFGWKGLRFF